MKHERPTEKIRELAALYALGALTQHEARSFEIHLLDGCAICEAELKKFKSAASRLGLAAEEAAPPEYIRDLLMARVERESRPMPGGESMAAAAPLKTAPPGTGPQLFSHSERRKSGTTPWLIAVLLIIAVIIAGIYIWY